MGRLNYQGSQGFEQNHAKAFEYFSKAAEAGNGDALGYLGKIYAEGSESVKQNNATALKYFKKAADKVRVQHFLVLRKFAKILTFLL